MTKLTRRQLAQKKYDQSDKGKARRKTEEYVAKRKAWLQSEAGIQAEIKHRAGRFGLTAAEWLGLYERQRHLCAICERPETTPAASPKGRLNRARRLAVDHDHKTGRVRGLLCRSCNIMVGCAEDNPERLERAIAYLCRGAP